jgi:hypothetical protein
MLFASFKNGNVVKVIAVVVLASVLLISFSFEDWDDAA